MSESDLDASGDGGMTQAAAASPRPPPAAAAKLVPPPPNADDDDAPRAGEFWLLHEPSELSRSAAS